MRAKVVGDKAHGNDFETQVTLLIIERECRISIRRVIYDYNTQTRPDHHHTILFINPH